MLLHARLTFNEKCIKSLIYKMRVVSAGFGLRQLKVRSCLRCIYLLRVVSSTASGTFRICIASSRRVSESQKCLIVTDAGQKILRAYAARSDDRCVRMAVRNTDSRQRLVGLGAWVSASISPILNDDPSIGLCFAIQKP